MSTRWKLGITGLLVGALVACSPGTSTPPPPDNSQLVEKNAWTGDIPSDAQVVSPDDFRAGLASGDQSLISTADLAAQQAARDAQFQQDKATLQALPNKSPDVQALLAEAASASGYDGDRPVKGPGGQTVVLFGLGTRLHNAVQDEQLAQSVADALSDYRLTYDLLGDDLKAKAPSPDSLQGKSLSEVKAALDTVNGLLEGQPSPVRPEANGGVSAQAINPGNGSDQDASCTAPSGYVKQYWFPLKNFISPVKNQGSRGTCWDFSAIGAVESRERVQNNNAVNLSEQFLANKVKQDWDASDYSDGYSSVSALNTAVSKNQPFPGEGGWTYNTASGRPSVKDGDSASYANSCSSYSGTCSDTAHESRRTCTTFIFKFCSYVKVTFGGPGVAASKAVFVWKNGDSFNLNRYRLLLGQGHVLIASFPVYRGFDEAAAGVVSNYDKTSYSDKDKKYISESRGGHVVQIVGFLSNDDLSSFGNTPKIGGGGYFIIKNSWGCGAGDGGYYYVPADYVQQIFSDLYTLDFDAKRSDAWTKEQANPGGSQAPSIQVKANPASVDLRVETDLAQFFKVSHPVAKSVTLTVTSDKDGTVYNGPWSTDTNVIAGPVLKFTFASAGLRHLNLLARYGSSQASATLNVNVVNTPPTLTLSSSGDAHQSEPYQITAVIADKNEPDPNKLCATTVWSVDAPDALSATTGCQINVTFGATGSRTVSATTTDSDGAATTKTLTLTVQPPSVNPYPTITDAGVFTCGGPRVANGATIDLTARGCGNNSLINLARATVDNPSNEALTYEWAIYLTYSGSEHLFVKSSAASSNSFQLYSPYNAGPGTDPCRVTVKVNAPDPSRSKSQTIWSGNCYHYSFQLN